MIGSIRQPSREGANDGRDIRRSDRPGLADSEPWWPPEPTPPDGSPNVVLIVLDDVGFAQLGCYGSAIDTPVIDRLAGNGLRLANFHTTAAVLPRPAPAC